MGNAAMQAMTLQSEHLTGKHVDHLVDAFHLGLKHQCLNASSENFVSEALFPVNARKKIMRQTLLVR